MEDAAKAIELAVGVIIFIVALTIAIVLYNKLADTANNALTINETKNSVVYNKNDIPSNFGYVYTAEDIYYLIQDIKGNDLYSKLTDVYICNGHANGNNTGEDIIDLNSYVYRKTRDNIKYENSLFDNNSMYKVKYEYEYIEKDILTELNTHKPKVMYIIKYVEEF